MEYARFGTGYVQREDADHEWRAVPADEEGLAERAIADERARALRERGTPGARIIKKV